MTVASFLQRLGRTGRRAGTPRNCLFLATNRESLTRAAALLRLWKEGFVEPRQPPLVPYPVVAQQIMALICQNSGASRRFDDTTIRRAVGQPEDTVERLMAHMLTTGILFCRFRDRSLGPLGCSVPGTTWRQCRCSTHPYYSGLFAESRTWGGSILFRSPDSVSGQS
jgi:ATP-dependent Lhr-like helicase